MITLENINDAEGYETIAEVTQNEPDSSVSFYELFGESLDMINGIVHLSENGDTAIIEVQEDLDFHISRLKENFIKVLDNEGGLSEKSIKIFEDTINKEMCGDYTVKITGFTDNTENVDMDELRSGEYEMYIAHGLIFEIDLNKNMAVSEFIDGVLWNFYATYNNITDPGTFWKPYVFDEMVRDA